jgi:hydrogenase/urease accessory protein HupE
MNLTRFVFLAVLLSALGAAAQAHEVRPGYLELRQFDAETWDLLWKVPARGDRRLALDVRLPGNCQGSEPVAHLVNGAYVERRRTRCDGGLLGREIAIAGLPATGTDVLVRVNRSDGTAQTVRLTPGAPAFTVNAVPGAWQVVRTYLSLGVEHILLGIDHLLFVLALLFLVGSWPRLIGTVTAFTLAHSLTLAAATLGWIRVPVAPVEALIALSIVFVATEIVHARQGRMGLAARLPWVVAFVFGLLHGLGFASALREVGLPEHAIPLALAFFNVGVELGQLLFIGAVFAVLWLPRLLVARPTSSATNPWQQAERFSVPAAYLVGTVAMFWVLERTYSFMA